MYFIFVVIVIMKIYLSSKKLFCIAVFFINLFISVGSIMNIHKLSSWVTQNITRKRLANKNAKPIGILLKLNLQFENDTSSRFQVYKWHKLFKNGKEEGKTSMETSRVYRIT